jgi:hypothetical protein
MRNSKNHQENSSELKEQITQVFSIVADLLRANNFTEALGTINSHFAAHLDYAFGKNTPQQAPLFFVDSIVSEYFLFRPYPDSPEKPSLLKPENSRHLQLTAAIIIDELITKNLINRANSETLSRPEVLNAVSAAKNRL